MAIFSNNNELQFSVPAGQSPSDTNSLQGVSARKNSIG